MRQFLFFIVLVVIINIDLQKNTFAKVSVQDELNVNQCSSNVNQEMFDVTCFWQEFNQAGGADLLLVPLDVWYTFVSYDDIKTERSYLAKHDVTLKQFGKKWFPILKQHILKNDVFALQLFFSQYWVILNAIDQAPDLQFFQGLKYDVLQKTFEANQDFISRFVQVPEMGSLVNLAHAFEIDDTSDEKVFCDHLNQYGESIYKRYQVGELGVLSKLIEQNNYLFDISFRNVFSMVDCSIHNKYLHTLALARLMNSWQMKYYQDSLFFRLEQWRFWRGVYALTLLEKISNPKYVVSRSQELVSFLLPLSFSDLQGMTTFNLLAQQRTWVKLNQPTSIHHTFHRVNHLLADMFDVVQKSDLNQAQKLEKIVAIEKELTVYYQESLVLFRHHPNYANAKALNQEMTKNLLLEIKKDPRINVYLSEQSPFSERP